MGGLEIELGRSAFAGRITQQFVQIYYLLLFCITGFSALIYQIVWQRILTNFTGADTLSVTLVVGAFMGGLGFGSLCGGYIADKLSDLKRIVLFAFTQAGIACFAFISTWLYYDVLYLYFGHLAKSAFLMTLALFISLLWPTFLMGMSLPLLAKTLTRRLEKASEITGYLYGFNTLGAAAGALATTWFLVRHVGLDGAIQLGAMLNIFTAIASTISLPLFNKVLIRNQNNIIVTSVQIGNGPTIPMAESPFLRVRTWIFIYGISGFVALSLEILWFRILGVMLKSTTFTFGHLLAILLGSMAIGTFCGTWCVRRSKNTVQNFFAFQAGITIYTVVFLTLFISVLPDLSIVNWFWSYFGRDDPLNMKTALSSAGMLDFVRLYFILPLALIGPPAFLMGLSYPYLQKIVQQDLAALGRRVGWLQTANILGSMLGTFITGWILLSFVGSLVTLKILLCVSGVFVLLHFYSRFQRSSFFKPIGITVLAVVILLWIMPSPTVMWANLHGTSSHHIITREDSSGLSVLKNESPDFSGMTKVFVNGLGQSTIPFYDFHITLGIVPAMVHPDPKDIAIIGMGAGATLFAAGGRQETKNLTCIEIVKPLLHTLTDYHERHTYIGLQSVLNDHRINYVFGDGRSVILNGGEKYDIIEADALRTTSAYSGNLFSYEYFLLLKNHLNAGGIAVTAAPTQRIINAFVKVFPYAVLVRTNDTLILGSSEEIEWDTKAISARLTNSFSRNYYSRVGIDVESFIPVFAAQHRVFTPDFDRSKLEDFNTDLFPRDEFLAP